MSASRHALPITLISGFLGAGKTTVLGSMLRQPHGLKMGVIVNDMSALNIDGDIARTLKLWGLDGHPETGLVELQNGCICCTLREDLVREIVRLVEEGTIDYLIIESTGISEPLPVARTFGQLLPDAVDRMLGDVARLDTLVTVVDGSHFIDMYRAGEALENDEARRTISDLLIEQIEFANVLLISKVDEISSERLAELKAILEVLNPAARIVHAAHGAIPHSELINTGAYAPEQMSLEPAWIMALQGKRLPESEEFGIDSFVWEARRPLHPQRFWKLLSSPWAGGELLRSKGFFWLASRVDSIGLYQQAGGTLKIEHVGSWWATVPEELWPRRSDIRDWIIKKWREPFGDRRQEIVFIGRNMRVDIIKSRLENCLLNDAEFAEGPCAWMNMPDPFPK